MGNNCGGMRHPDPKSPDVNYCGNYKTNPNGRGYTRELISTDTDASNFTIPDYCVPHGPPTIVPPATLEVISVFGGLIAGLATGGTGFALVTIGAAAAAAGEAADQAVVDNLTYKYKDQMHNYCKSVGDSVVTEEGTQYMWSGLTTALDKCKYDISEPGGTDAQQEFCVKRFFYDPGQCYASHDGYTYFEHPGICDGVATRNGINAACSRNPGVFPGNPFVCCMSDYAVNNDGEENPPSCYEDPVSKQRTCDPLHRDLAAPTCQDVVEPYCLGEKSVPGANSFLELWTPESEVNLSSFMEIDNTLISNNWKENVVSGYPIAGNNYPNNPTTIAERQAQTNKQINVKAPCLNAIARSIYNGPGVKNWDDLAQLTLRRSDIDPVGLAWAQELVYKFYKKYTKDYGSFIGTINTDGNIKSDQFKEVIGSICGKFPFLCSEFLSEACSSVTSEEFVYLEADARSWCGCYMKSDQYEKYTNLDIPLECTPTCNSSKVIPLVDGNYVPKVCKDTVCVIDQLNLDITNSIYPGGFNFNQLCTSCGPVDQVESGVEGMIYDQITGNNAFIMSSTSGPNLRINNDIISINNVDIKFTSVLNYYFSREFTLYDTDGNFLLNNGVLVLDSNLKIIQLAGEDDLNVLTSVVNKEVIIGTQKNNAKAGDKFSVPSNPTKVTIIKGTVSFSSDISAYTNVGNDTDIIRANTCTCILPDEPMDVENSKIGSFNLNQVCGASKCYNSNKEPIPCASGSIEYSAINTVEDSLTNFKATTIENKNNFSLLIISLIFFFFSLIFLRIFKDNLNSGTKYFTWTMILLIIIFVILSAIKIVDEDKDLSKYF